MSTRAGLVWASILVVWASVLGARELRRRRDARRTARAAEQWLRMQQRGPR